MASHRENWQDGDLTSSIGRLKTSALHFSGTKVKINSEYRGVCMVSFLPPPHPTPPLPLCLSLFIVFSQRQKHGNPQLESDVENCWPHLWTSCILVLVLAIRHVITCFSGTSYIYLYLIYLYTSYGTILTNLGKFGIN